MPAVVIALSLSVLDRVVAPFSAIAPLPVENVVVPVWEKFPAVVMLPFGPIENLLTLFTWRSTNVPAYPVAAFAKSAPPLVPSTRLSASPLAARPVALRVSSEPVVVLLPVRLTSAPVNAPVLVIATAFPLKVEVLVSMLTALPVVSVFAPLMLVGPFSVTAPLPVLKVPAPVWLKFLPDATVTSPFSETAPVPVLNVVVPVCEKLPVVVMLPVGPTVSTLAAFTWKSAKLPVNPVAAFA